MAYRQGGEPLTPGTRSCWCDALSGVGSQDLAWLEAKCAACGNDACRKTDGEHQHRVRSDQAGLERRGGASEHPDEGEGHQTTAGSNTKTNLRERPADDGGDAQSSFLRGRDALTTNGRSLYTMAEARDQRAPLCDRRLHTRKLQ